MKNVLSIIILVLMLIGCDGNVPDGWQALNTNSMSIESKVITLDAKQEEWQSVMRYDSKYNYTIKVFANTIGFNSNPYKSLARGSISSCNEGCFAFNGVPDFNSGNTGRVVYRIIGDGGYTIESGLVRAPLTFSGAHGVGATFTIKAAQSGDLQMRIHDQGDYTDNNGQYEVTIEYPKQESSFVSDIAESVLTPITSQVRVVSMQFWENFVNSNTTKSIITTMMVLYIMMIGIFIVTGSTKFSLNEIIITTLKLGVVTALISPLSYNFFNEYLFQLFVEGQADLVNAITTPDASVLRSGVINYDSAFSFTNYVINSLFSGKFFLILISFLLWFPIGWFCIILIMLAFIEYTIAIVEAFVLYLVATTAVQLLISMGPIFISLILFEKTRPYFNKWIGSILAFAMQPVVLFACIMIIATLISGSLANIMNLTIVWKCVQPFYLNLGPNPFDNDANVTIPLGCLYWFNPVTNILDVVRDSLILYLLVRLIKQITTIATDITAYIFDGGEMLGGAGQIAAAAGEAIRSTIKNGGKPPTPGEKKDDGKKDDKKSDNGGDQNRESRPGAQGDKGVAVSKPSPYESSSSGGSGSGVSVSGGSGASGGAGGAVK